MGSTLMGALQKYYLLTELENTIIGHVWENHIILNATKPKSKKQQPWITINANNAWQAALHAMCMRKVASMCTQEYGYAWVHLFMDECRQVRGQACKLSCLSRATGHRTRWADRPAVANMNAYAIIITMNINSIYY